MKVSELKKVLNQLKPFVATDKSTDRQCLLGFHFDKNYVEAGNGFAFCRIPFLSLIQCTVPATEFHSLIKTLTTDVKLSVSNKKLVVESGSVNAKFHLIDEKYPELSFPKNFDKLPKEFMSALEKIQFTAVSPIGVLVGEKAIYSTDNFRISKCGFNGKIKRPFVIEPELVKLLLTFDIQEYKVTDNDDLFFKTKDGTLIRSKALPNDAPGTEKFYNYYEKAETLFDELEDDGFEIEVYSTMKDSVLRHSIVQTEKEIEDRLLNVSAVGKIKSLRMISEGAGIGKIDEEVDIPEYIFGTPEGKLDFNIPVFHFKEILDRAPTYSKSKDNPTIDFIYLESSKCIGIVNGDFIHITKVRQK